MEGFLLEAFLFPLSESSKKKLEKLPLSEKERAEVDDRFPNRQCSFHKTPDGKYFCMTHRCRSKFYDSIAEIPKKTVDFVSSTS